jgi:hypothetical protein
VLVLDAAWSVALPTATGKLFAGLGALTALLLIATHTPSRLPRAAWIALALLPAISLVAVPHVAFWRVDGRAWVVIAWLAGLAALDAAKDRRAIAPFIPAALFVAWASAFWLTIVLDLGLARVIGSVDRTVGGPCRSDALTTIASIWESSPVSEHLFLGWRSAANFADRVVYENHVHPFLLTMYGWIGFVRAVAHVPTFVASNTTPLLSMAVLVAAMTTLLARSGALGRRQGLLGVLVLFVAVGMLVSTWRFWIDLYRFGSDNPYPLLAALFVVTYALLLPPAAPRLSVAAAVAFVAMSPIHLPMLILAVLCLFGARSDSVRGFVANNGLVLRLCLTAAAVAIVVMALPWALAAWKGYRGQGSTFLFRSGLDGDTSYFTNMLQAAWSACPVNCCGGPRPIMNLLFPAFLPLLVFAWPAGRSPDAAGLGGVGRMASFFATPYLVSLVFFPQSISIHPYLYDHLLLGPAVIAGAAAMAIAVRPARLHGPALLWFLLVSAATIMSNLIAIAQGLAPLR